MPCHHTVANPLDDGDSTASTVTSLAQSKNKLDELPGVRAETRGRSGCQGQTSGGVGPGERRLKMVGILMPLILCDSGFHVKAILFHSMKPAPLRHMTRR